MAKEPVSIGNQKFIYDDKSQTWIDAKTKQPADKGLLAILESVSKDIPAKPKRLNIDRSVEPVTLGSMKYVYDKNMGWVDEKTKVPADLKLAKALNDAVGNKKEAVKKNISKSVTSATGSFVSSKKDVKTDVAYRKISDGLAQALASVERMNGHSHNIIMMNRFRFKEDARVSREKAREGGSSGSSQMAGNSAAQTMAVMSVLVSTVTVSMKEFTAALKDAAERGALGGGGGLLGGVTDVVEEGSNTAAKVVGGAMVAFAGASYAGIAMKKASEDDDDSPDSAPPVSQASAVPVNRQQQAPEEGEEEETEQTQMKSAAAGGAIAARAAKDIPTPEEKSEPDGGGGSRSRNIKVETVSPDQKMGRMEEPKTKPKTAIKVKKEEKKAAPSGGGGGSKAPKRVPTAGPKGKPPGASAPAQKSTFFPKVAWGKAFASIGKVLADMKKAAELALKNAANAASNAGQVVGDTISGVGSAVTGAVGEMVYGTVQPPTKGLPGMLYAAAKKAGYDDNMAIALVAVCEKETGFKLRPEVMNYTSANRIYEVFKRNKEFKSWTPAMWQPYVRQPQKLANRVYGGKLGNDNVNDGWTYRGRGLQGITFKSTYAQIGKIIGVDLVRNPDALNNMNVALPAWLAYYEMHPIIKRRGKKAATLDEAIIRVVNATAGTSEKWHLGGGTIQKEAMSKSRQFAAKYTAGGLARMAQSVGDTITGGVQAVGNYVGGAVSGAVQTVKTAAGAFRGIVGLASTQAQSYLSSIGIKGGNGQLSTSQLEPTGQLGTYAAPPAARAYKAMVAAARKDGVNIQISGPRSAYRTFRQQQEIFATARPGYAAKPGSSNHGWGLAFDIAGTGKDRPEGKISDWLFKNAAKFGIYGPLGSARKAAGGNWFEPWHWEFRGGGQSNPVTENPTQTSASAQRPPVLQPGQSSRGAPADQAIQQVALRQAVDKRDRNARAQNGGRVQTPPPRGKATPPPPGGGKKKKVETSAWTWKSLFG